MKNGSIISTEIPLNVATHDDAESKSSESSFISDSSANSSDDEDNKKPKKIDKGENHSHK